MKSLQEQYKLLLDDRKYFTSYKEKFIHYLLEELPQNLKEDRYVNSLVNKIYDLSFNFENEKTVLNELYTTLYRSLEKNINIKPALSKAYLKFLKDYIDHIIDTNKNIIYIKAFISVIEEYIHTIDKAHLDYIEKLKKEIDEVKNKQRQEEIKTILTLLRNYKKHKQKFEIITYYKELAIICKGSIKDVSVHTITLDISTCLKKPFRKDKYVYMKIGHPSKVLRGKIREINPFEGILILDEFQLTDLPQEKRKCIRVRLNKKPKTIIKYKDSFLEGIIDDISVNGVGLYIEDKKDINIGDKIELKIPLPKNNLILRGRIVHITPKGPLFKLGVQFENLSQKDESILGEFITDKQFEILKEIRE